MSICLHIVYDCFPLQWQSWVIVTETDPQSLKHSHLSSYEKLVAVFLTLLFTEQHRAVIGPWKQRKHCWRPFFLMAQWADSRRWMPSSVPRCVVCSHLKEEEPVTPISFSACLWPPNLRITHYRGSLDLPKSSLLRTSLLLRGSQTRYGCLLIFKCGVDLWMVSFCKASSWTRDCSLSPASVVSHSMPRMFITCLSLLWEMKAVMSQMLGLCGIWCAVNRNHRQC